MACHRHPAGSHDVSEGRFLPPPSHDSSAPGLFALFQGTRSGCAEAAFGFVFVFFLREFSKQRAEQSSSRHFPDDAQTHKSKTWP